MGSATAKTLKTARAKTTPAVAAPSLAWLTGESPKLELLKIIQPITPHLAKVEEAMTRQVRGFDVSVQEYIRYALEGHGKRLRPVLALLSGGVCGKVGDAHVNLSVIVELIHLATLVHDDVIDEAEVRRSKPTANSRWGNEIPVLVGDCIFAHALKLAASYPTTVVCRKISEATNIVCAGELLQTRERFNFDMTVDEYLRIVEMKTAALFAVSCELGAHLSGASEKQAQALRDYGRALGIAYQIYDDCVDIFGDDSKAGKSLGTDADSGKLTLPLLLYLREANAHERKRVRRMLLESGLAHRKEIAEAAAQNGVLKGTLNLIESHSRAASRYLDCLSDSEASRSLRQLADFLLQQSQTVLPFTSR